MASNAELQAEVDRLNAEADALAEERDRLAEELEKARANAVAQPNSHPKPTEPSYKLSEGQRAELEMNGKAVSPFTGARQVGTGTPGEVPRVVSSEEFDKVGK